MSHDTFEATARAETPAAERYLGQLSSGTCHMRVENGGVTISVRASSLMIARPVSLLSLGLLSVAVSVQVYDLSGSSFLVGIAMTLGGAGMFVGAGG